MTKQGNRPEEERVICLRLLTDVLEKGRFLHLALAEELDCPDLSSEEKAFITRLTRGCVESRETLDEIIDSVSSVKCRKMRPVIRNILRMSAYQTFYMDVPEHAVCNEAVKLTEKAGIPQLKSFVNGVSRGLVRKAAGQKGKKQDNLHFLPEWLDRKMEQWYGRSTADRFAAACGEGGKPLCIRILTSYETEEAVIAMLREDGAEVTKAPYAKSSYQLRVKGDLRNLKAYREGLFIVQDPASSLAADCLSPAPESLVLDVCSAPGGKTIALADIMKGTGRVISRDLSEKKCARIKENVSRCRLNNVEIAVRDAREPDLFYAGKADCVLADVPCSGLGVLRQKPDILLHLKKEGLDNLPALQLEIAGNAADLVKPGGVMVYSTCTVNPEENIHIVRKLLERGDLVPEDLGPFLKEVPEGCDPSSGMLQLIPGLHRCDGFFLARLRKVNTV